MLHPETADVRAGAGDRRGVETRIAQLARQGLGTRKIAAFLESEGYPLMSHMTVACILRREAQLPPG